MMNTNLEGPVISLLHVLNVESWQVVQQRPVLLTRHTAAGEAEILFPGKLVVLEIIFAIEVRDLLARLDGPPGQQGLGVPLVVFEGVDITAIVE